MDETLFLAEQLRTIKKNVYKKEFPARQSLTGQFPVSSEADAGDEEIGYDIITSVGMAEIVSDYADDIKRAEVSKEREVATIRTIATEIIYNFKEIKKALKTKTDLKMLKGTSARELIEIKLNKIIWFGDEKYGLYGMLNHPSFPAGTVQTGANSGNIEWSTKTDDEILKDLSDLINDVKIITKGVEYVDSIAMGVASHGVISSRRIGNTNTTIKKFFLENNPEIKNIYINPELDNVKKLPSGTSGTKNVVIAYNNNLEKLSVEIPMDMEFLPETRKNLAWHVPLVSMCGGILAPRPMSVNIIEGV